MKEIFKTAISVVFYFTGGNLIGLGTQKLLYRSGYIRAVHYHETPTEQAANFERHLQFFQRHFASVTAADLDQLLTGSWGKSKPGLLLTFDDGVRSHFDVAMPLLEKYGFTGWFFAAAAFTEKASGQFPQNLRRSKAKDKTDVPAAQDDAGGSLFMTWRELRELLARKHVVGCHTMTHWRLGPSTPEDKLRKEIVEAKHLMERRLNRPIDAFCWAGGEEWSYSREAARRIRDAGYKYAFMSNNQPISPMTNRLQLQRTNIEASWPLHRIRFSLSGVMDLAYTGKRRRINRLTAIDTGIE